MANITWYNNISSKTNLFPLILLYGLKFWSTSSKRKSSRPGPFAKLSFCSFESDPTVRLLQLRCLAISYVIMYNQ